MKTRSIIPSVRLSIVIVTCPLVLSGILPALPVNANQATSPSTNIAMSAARTPGIHADLRFPFFQLPVADAFNPDENPFESLRQPWYIRIWPESRILRILMIGGIIMGIKALFSKKSGTNPVSSQQQQTAQRTTQQTTTPPTSSASTRVQPTVSDWFYHANGTDFGPFDEAALRQLKNAGVFGPATYIRRADGGNWITYADVFGPN